MGPPAQKQLDCLYFVKRAIPDSKDIIYQYSHIINRLDEPVNLQEIYDRVGVSEDDYDIFIDPMTNGMLKHQTELN